MHFSLVDYHARGKNIIEHVLRMDLEVCILLP